MTGLTISRHGNIRMSQRPDGSRLHWQTHSGGWMLGHGGLRVGFSRIADEGWRIEGSVLRC